jgi:hypothetical protein
MSYYCVWYLLQILLMNTRPARNDKMESVLTVSLVRVYDDNWHFPYELTRQ